MSDKENSPEPSSTSEKPQSDKDTRTLYLEDVQAGYLGTYGEWLAIHHAPESEQRSGIHVLGEIEKKEDLPDPTTLNGHDAFTQGGVLWIVTPDATGKHVWTSVELFGSVPRHGRGTEGLLIFGVVKSCEELPDPKSAHPDAAYVEIENGVSYVWRLNRWDVWERVELVPGASEEFNSELEEVQRREDLQDAGYLARLKMEANHKRTKRRMWWYRIQLWFVFWGVIAAVGYFGYGYVMEHVQYGRYSDERSCKVSKDGLTVTGKRSFSYPYKSIFGYRLVDENKVLVQTTINVQGDRMEVMGLKDKKYWITKIGPGEKGIQILKPADTYIFRSDKNIIVATEAGFCNPIQRELSADELKQPEQDVIK